MSKRKVLQVSCDSLGYGGVQTVIMNIVHSLKDEMDFDVLIFLDDYPKREFERYGTIFKILKKQSRNKIRRRIDALIWPLRIFLGTIHILQHNGPYDVIHCHNYFESGICLLAAKLVGVPVRISHSHSSRFSSDAPNWRMRLYQSVLQYCIRKAAIVMLGCSEGSARLLFRGKNESIIMPNAIDLAQFDRSKYPATDANSFRLIQIGQICENKNQIFSLKVFDFILSEYKDATMVFIGDGYQKEKLLEMINICGWSDRVWILPPDTDIPLYLSRSDIMLFPSHYEGFGIVLIEAQAMGLTCFASTAVPRETNLGLCHYLDLEDGSKAWADTICTHFQQYGKTKQNVDATGFLLERYIDRIREIYNGKKCI